MSDLFARISAGIRALRGEPDATRAYCGSYYLVRDMLTKKLYRCDGKLPPGFLPIREVDGKTIYDKDGFLLPEYWALSRIIDGVER